MRELEYQGINSIGIVVIISVFVGAVITIQTNYNIESPLLPRYLIGVGVRDTSPFIAYILLFQEPKYNVPSSLITGEENTPSLI